MFLILKITCMFSSMLYNIRCILHYLFTAEDACDSSSLKIKPNGCLSLYQILMGQFLCRVRVCRSLLVRTSLSSWLTFYVVYFNNFLLLIQFDDIGEHGTKVIVFNLWFNDDGDMELDFNSDGKVCNVGLLWSYIC